jgi:hypothetical protein
MEVVMTLVLTSKENIAINLLFEWLGEERYNRTIEEYAEIATRVPKLEAIYVYVNERLAQITATGTQPYQICYFKVGDRHHWYADYPSSLSRETVRSAVNTFFGPLLPGRRPRRIDPAWSRMGSHGPLVIARKPSQSL